MLDWKTMLERFLPSYGAAIAGIITLKVLGII